MAKVALSSDVPPFGDVDPRKQIDEQASWAGKARVISGVGIV